MGVLDGKVVVVTGAGQGIGREEALACARAGARVVVDDLAGAAETAAAVTAEGGQADDEHEAGEQQDELSCHRVSSLGDEVGRDPWKLRVTAPSRACANMTRIRCRLVTNRPVADQHVTYAPTAT